MVAVISLAVCLLVAAMAALLVRLSRRGTPPFQHLDEVPMVRGGGFGEGAAGPGCGRSPRSLSLPPQSKVTEGSPVPTPS